MSSDPEIVAKVARRAADPEKRIDGEPLYDPPPPLDDPDFLIELEHELGFALPGLLKALFLQVGDGGFGPGYGLYLARQRTRPPSARVESFPRKRVRQQ